MFHLMHNRLPKLAMDLGSERNCLPFGPSGLNLGSLGSLDADADRLLNLLLGVGVLVGVLLVLSRF